MSQSSQINQWQGELERLEEELRATVSRTVEQEIWGEGLGGDDIRGGVTPENQYGYGPILMGYETVDVDAPDEERRSRAANELRQIFQTHPAPLARKRAANLLGYGWLKTALNELRRRT